MSDQTIERMTADDLRRLAGVMGSADAVTVTVSELVAREYWHAMAVRFQGESDE